MEVGTPAFDTRARVVECASCGGMLEAPLEGERTVCRRCGAANEILPRFDVPLRAALEDEEAERARLDRLIAQRDLPTPVEIYDLDAPPAGFTADPDRDRGSADALRSAWNAARPTLWQVSPARQRDALWLALHLADLYVAQNDPQRARALLETALDLLGDEGLRHLIRCRLAILALWSGDAPSAYVWLCGCDFAATELPLDSALREGQAQLAEATGDHALVLSLVGEAHLAVPIATGWERTCGALRVRALSALGRDDEADAELQRLIASVHGLAIDEAVGKAHPVVLRHYRALLARAAADRDALPSGWAAVWGEMVKLPYLAIAVLVLVTLPRVFFDADATGGAEGYALCRYTCADCRGPFRVYTYVSRSAGSVSTSGADYYCSSPSNDVSALADSELAARHAALGAISLSFAPGALTYLGLLGLLAPISFAAGVREHFAGAARRREREAALAALAAAAELPVPAPEPAPSKPVSREASWNVFRFAALAAVVIAVELVVHRLRWR